ncbi:helix-turn-helix domain-containing protein [Plantactinospora siamensis]|uniref:Helix-turn-helix domain-containing protein n=1 Tax=Plantactinospora siamensis TaxID=555372 RepID=A0ABV6P3B7_9ACTN
MTRDGTEQRRRVRLDHRQVRVLAHPLRMRLLGALRVRGPATATALAERLATNTGATSYHLRQLAEVGLVAEAPELGSGRQRWWRAAHEITSWDPSDFDDDPDARAAIEWIQGDQVRILLDQAERWFAAQHDQPSAWRDAAGMGDMLLTLTPDRLEALKAEVFAILTRYHEAPPADGSDARPVQVFLAGYPMLDEGSA